MPDSPPTSTKQAAAWQFTIQSLLGAVFLISWILAVNRWLGSPYGWLTAIPLSVVALLALRARGKILIGAAFGFAGMAIIGCAFIIEWNSSDPRLLKSAITIGSFGARWGASLNAIVIHLRVLGALALVAAAVIFGFTLHT